MLPSDIWSVYTLRGLDAVEYLFDLAERTFVEDGYRHRDYFLFLERREFFREFLLWHRITFGEEHALLFFAKRGIVFLELAANRFVIAYDIVRFGGDEMKKRFRALDMFQEFYAKPLALRGSFYQSGNIGDDEPVICAKVRLQRCKSITPHFGSRGGKLVQEARFARIRQSHEPNVGYQPQLKAIGHRVALRTLFKFFWRRVGARAEFEIAAPALAAASNQDALSCAGDLLHISGLHVDDARARRHFEYQIWPVRAVDELSSAIAAVLCLYFLSAPKRLQCVDVCDAFQIDRRSPAAVAARGTQHQLHFVERNGTAPAAPCVQLHRDFVYQHVAHANTIGCPVLRRPCKGKPPRRGAAAPKINLPEKATDASCESVLSTSPLVGQQRPFVSLGAIRSCLAGGAAAVFRSPAAVRGRLGRLPACRAPSSIQSLLGVVASTRSRISASRALPDTPRRHFQHRLRRRRGR